MGTNTSAAEATPPCPGWSRTPRGRRELLALGLFGALTVLVPLATTELFPFSQAPMFADRPTRYADYAVLAPDGRALDPLRFGLQRNYWGNPLGVGVGHRPPASVDTFGEVADEAEVRAAVVKQLLAEPDLPWVEVVQRVVADRDGTTVGVARERRWRVERPASLEGRADR